MEQRIYHGNISPEVLAQNLIAHFNRGNFQVQQIGTGSQIAVQIATRDFHTSGGQTALSVKIQNVEDGICVQVGNQAWYGIAASLGLTALAALQNPFTLLGRLDDIAQDLESIQLVEEVWRVVDETAHAMGAAFDLSEKLRRITCSYCGSANPVGESTCIACGAPLGGDQPRTCKSCGYVLTRDGRFCPNCGKQLN